MKHVMDAPLHEESKTVVNGQHHLYHPKGAMSFERKFCGWLIGAQVVSL